MAAALDLIAEGGPTAATVRAIADRAGVTPGLIRHYFSSKEHLTQEAYRFMMQQMQADNAAVLDAAPADPSARLAAFVAAALRPVMTPRQLGLWAGFIHQVQHDPDMAVIHAETYLGYRDLLESLIAALGPNDPTRLRSLAIACNGVIDERRTGGVAPCPPISRPMICNASALPPSAPFWAAICWPAATSPSPR